MHITKADDREEFEDRVAARKMSGGRSRFNTFKNLATNVIGNDGEQGTSASGKNKSNNNNNNSSKKPVPGKKGRSSSVNSHQTAKNQNKNTRGSSSNSNKNKKPTLGGGLDPLAQVAARMATKRRKIEASD